MGFMFNGAVSFDIEHDGMQIHAYNGKNEHIWSMVYDDEKVFERICRKLRMKGMVYEEVYQDGNRFIEGKREESWSM